MSGKVYSIPVFGCGALTVKQWAVMPFNIHRHSTNCIQVRMKKLKWTLLESLCLPKSMRRRANWTVKEVQELIERYPKYKAFPFKGLSTLFHLTDKEAEQLING